MNDLVKPAPTLQRDRYGRPLIRLPDGSRVVPYTRVTTLAKTLEEQSALTAWKQRMTLVGASLAPHLMLSVAAHREDRDKLNELAGQAMEAAQAGAKAEIGTSLHRICETIDLGGDPGPYPEQYAPDIRAYQAATGGIEWLAVEQFIVLDDMQVAGTTDRIGVYKGRPVIADIKTGSIEYGALSIACQLACYANGEAYDVATCARTPLPEHLDDKIGLVIHLPAGQGRCELHEVDLHAGYDAALQSIRVRDMRRGAKGWMRPVPLEEPADADPQPDAQVLRTWISQAPDAEALASLWTAHPTAFTPELTELAGARHALLVAGLA